MSDWRVRRVSYRADWTGRGQGVATDGEHWYVTSNDDNPGVFRYSPDFGTQLAFRSIPRSVAGHVGAVAVTDGVVYVALEGPEAVATYTPGLDEVARVGLARPTEADEKAHLAWCAINPANGLLYTCAWNQATSLEAYDPTSGDRSPDDDIALSASIDRTQGGVFSDGGRVYLASDQRLTRGEYFRRYLPFGGRSRREIFPGIHGFDVPTGRKVGYVRVEIRPYIPFFEEVEGVGLGPMTVDGDQAHVHLAVLDKNHSWLSDDVHLTSFVVPEPDAL